MSQLTEKDREEMAKRKERRVKRRVKKRAKKTSKTMKARQREKSASQKEAERQRIIEGKRKQHWKGELDSESPIVQELANRELCKRHLLPYVQRFNPDYLAGWVHKDICNRLERFFHLVQRRKSPRIMLMVPPRHGKSTLSSIEFPSWALGNDPNIEIILASYALPLASGFSRQVRDRVQYEPEYQLIFPETQISPDSRGIEEWRIRRPYKGRLQAAGVGGPITGKGADCFPAGTLVQTPEGEKPIEELRTGDAVLSYNGQVFESYIEATNKRYADRFIEIRTASGKYIRTTPEHRIFVPSVGWVEAQSLQTGDQVSLFEDSNSLYGVRRDSGAASRRREESSEKGGERQVFSEMQRTSFEEKVLNVWRHVSPFQKPWGQLLLQRVSSKENDVGAKGLPRVWGELSNKVSEYAVLLSGLCRPSTFQTNAGAGEFSLQGGAGVLGTVQAPASFDQGKRRQLRDMWNARRAIGASHRPRQLEQRSRELDNDVSFPSHNSSQVYCDTISEVKPYRGSGEYVYDIQVARGHCFFAGEILVHNCLIIDDPVKNREEADSVIVQQSTWNWYTSTAYTRLSPGGGLIQILTRWSEQDLAGKSIDNARKSGEEWDIIRYSALSEDVEYYDTKRKIIHVGEPDPLPPHYKKLRDEGDPLHPARYDAKALHRIKETVGPRDWSALYQQRPVAEEGDYIRKKWFRYYTPMSYDGMKHIQAWDLAIGKNDQNNYTVGITIALDWDGRVHLREAIRGRWGTHEIAEQVLRKHIEYDSELVGIEHGHIFLAVEEDLRKLEKRYRVRPTYDDTLKPIHDKHVRARPMQGMFQGGNIIFPEDVMSRWPWLIEELLKFPALGRDDGFDALAWACRMLPNVALPRRGPHTTKATSWKDQLKQYKAGANNGGNHLLA